MEVEFNFTEIDAPTGKQIDLVQDIMRKLELRIWPQYTKQAYSDFIDEYVDIFKNQ